MKKNINNIFLDNNSTTLIDPNVIDVMVTELCAPPHNPSSTHILGQTAKNILTKCRSSISAYLNVNPNEIIFTSGGTEGLNLLIQGFHPKKPAHIIASSIDHSSVYETLLHMQKIHKSEISWLPVDRYGAPQHADLIHAIQPNTAFIVLSAANSETGVKLDINTFAKIANQHHIPLVLDGVALIGKEPLFIPDGVSAMAFSSHKFHGPKGSGFTFIKQPTTISPLIIGGGQENNMRSGTENLAGIVGMTHALTLMNPKQTSNILHNLREAFEAKLLAKIPDIEINGNGPRLPNTSNIYFPNIDGESLLIALDMRNISASHGSACSSGVLGASRTLINMGYSKKRALSSIRFSFSRFNTLEEIEQAVTDITDIIHNMHNLAHI